MKIELYMYMFSNYFFHFHLLPTCQHFLTSALKWVQKTHNNAFNYWYLEKCILKWIGIRLFWKIYDLACIHVMRWTFLQCLSGSNPRNSKEGDFRIHNRKKMEIDLKDSFKTFFSVFKKWGLWSRSASVTRILSNISCRAEYE